MSPALAVVHCMVPSFELFDHTADMGVRVRAAAPDQLLMPAAQGLYAIFGQLAAAENAPRPFAFQQEGTDQAVLLRDFLAELLVLFEHDKRVLIAIDSADFGPGRLHVTGQSAPVDPARSDYLHEVKAITYHELAVRPIEDGYEATYIVDI